MHKNNKITFFSHLLAWLVLFSMPYVLSYGQEQEINRVIMHFWIPLGFYAIIFYLNYYVLIDGFLFTKKTLLVKEHFVFPNTIMPFNPCTSISKSLYDREDSMNNFEQDMIMEIAALENVVFWHRNLTRGKGFFINGFSSNHYPDFILYTEKGSIVIIETKGDDRDNDDSRDKNRLGKTWAEKSGENYKYFMVFQNKRVEDTYNAKGIIEVMKRL